MRTPRRYILWNPASDKPPKCVFNTYREAKRAAERMAHAFYPAEFFVCALRSVARRSYCPSVPGTAQ